MALAQSIRRGLKRVLSDGPWRMLPFESAVTTPPRQNLSSSNFSRIWATHPGRQVVFHPLRPLFGRPSIQHQTDWESHFEKPSTVKVFPVRILGLEDAGVVSNDGVVYSRHSRTAISETVRRWHGAPVDHPILCSPRSPRARHLKGLSLSLLSLSAEGYYHFLFESVSRWTLLQKWAKQADHILANGSPDGFQAKWLKRAGVPIDKIVWMGSLDHVSCENLIFTDCPLEAFDLYPELIQKLVSIYDHSETSSGSLKSSPKKVWISRADACSRHIEWEDEILKNLPGFSRVSLGNLSPDEQIGIFEYADIIAGPHGAGFSNIIFCRPNTTVVEFLPEHMFKPLYGRLAQICELNHYCAQVDYENPPELKAFADRVSTL